jgi:glycosyltransferase involved in cell wall biosynthesis
MISIELISKGESSLTSVLQSIANQTFEDYEIICADSSNNNDVKNLLLTYRCKIIEMPKNSGALIARYNAHKYARGERSLILDSTRPLKNDALEILYKYYYNPDMVIIREDSLGNGFWVNQAKLLKNISEKQNIRLNQETLAFLLPRFYNSDLLTKAFDNIIIDTGNLFNKISYGEHHLIFEECKKISNHIGMTNEMLLSHHEDDSLIKEFLNTVDDFYIRGSHNPDAHNALYKKFEKEANEYFGALKI